jgi:formate hydrogenlyase subunit 3/multisubunit Na+/H+ antiporter MnhD subunit
MPARVHTDDRIGPLPRAVPAAAVRLNGAFLTGDLFNLFVFFEILLLASYGLLLHGGGRQRVKAGLHYVVINLVGSTLFLFAVGTLYGVTGTLNMADLAVKLAADAGGKRGAGAIRRPCCCSACSR